MRSMRGGFISRSRGLLNKARWTRSEHALSDLHKSFHERKHEKPPGKNGFAKWQETSCGDQGRTDSRKCLPQEFFRFS